MTQLTATTDGDNGDVIQTQGISGKAIFDVLSPLITPPNQLLFDDNGYDASLAAKQFQLLENGDDIYVNKSGAGGTTWVASRGGVHSLTKQIVQAAHQLNAVSLVVTQGVSGKAIFDVFSKLISAPSVLTFDGKPYADSLAGQQYASIQLDGDDYGYVEQPDGTTTWISGNVGASMAQSDAKQARSINVKSAASS
ncbi:hypothetical protein ACVW0Y_000140 [Pseudomonas sp. TE3786]